MASIIDIIVGNNGLQSHDLSEKSRELWGKNRLLITKIVEFVEKNR